MSDNATPDNKTRDFSNFRWTQGVRRDTAASVSRSPDGRTWLGVRGWTRDRQLAYVSVELDAAGLQQLQALLGLAATGPWPPEAKDKAPATTAAANAPAAAVAA